MRIFQQLGILSLILFLANPSILLAYTIVLKDGSTIQAQDSYRVKGDKAYITLVNGTQSVMDLKEIDVEATKEANLMDVGDARLIDDGEVRLIRPEPEVKKKELSLSELSRANLEAKAAAEAEAELAAEEENITELPRTHSGNVDLLGLPRRLYRSETISKAFANSYAELDVLDASFFSGTQNSRLFIEVITNTEEGVFAVLEATCQTLLSLDQGKSGVPKTVELLLLTGGRERAGQFTLNRERAEELVSGELSVQRFFVQYVEF